MESAVVGLGETPVKSKISEKHVDCGNSDQSCDTTTKRNNYLSWEDYFMSVALLSAQRSKDPSTQVGACIVNPENKIVGIGYNGMPVGCNDDTLPWGKESVDPLENKYAYVCHAEMNAIMNKNSADVAGCRLYATLFPCNECAKLIIQSRITDVIYMHDKPTRDAMRASRRLFDMARINYRKYEAQTRRIVIELGVDDELENVTTAVRKLC